MKIRIKAEEYALAVTNAILTDPVTSQRATEFVAQLARMPVSWRLKWLLLLEESEKIIGPETVRNIVVGNGRGRV